jgi:hypothetical protein
VFRVLIISTTIYLLEGWLAFVRLRELKATKT